MNIVDRQRWPLQNQRKGQAAQFFTGSQFSADQPKAPKAPTTPAPALGGGGGNKKVNMTQDSVKKPKKPVIIKILKKEFRPRVLLRKSRHKVDYSILDIK